MTPEEHIKALMDSIGAMGEVAFAMCNSFEKAGFSHADAMFLTFKMLTDIPNTQGRGDHNANS